MKQAVQTAPVTPKRGRRFLRYLLVFLLVFSLLLVIVTGAAIFWVSVRPLPQIEGSLQVSGLTAPVTVTRDKYGVAHVEAQNEADLFFAQGYVTAQDRLWQLDFNRRVGAGRLSEILGEAAIKEDKFLRTIGLRRAAEAEIADLPPEFKQILDNYAKGVNAYIEERRDNLPVEFTLLGYKPEPWTALDSIAWGKVMAYDLGGNYGREILRAALVEKFGAEQAAFLMPLGPAPSTPLIVPPAVSYKGMEDALALLEIQRNVGGLVGSDLSARGSNNWVAAASKTTTGKPIVANDPHLRVSNPAVWYQIGLKGAGWNVIGSTFPGVPGVVAGHNERIAWGVTNVEGDNQDLFIEKFNPANPNQYEFKGNWEEAAVRTEEIKIKGKPSLNLTVRVTRHGPVLNDAVEQLKDKQPMALKWVALDKSPLFTAVMKYNRASNWNEFRTALREFSIPAQNFVFADVDGNIGYQIPGLWPKRAQGDGLLPVPGWTGEYEWQGYQSFDDLPSVYNPAAGFIATANNRPVVPGSKVFLGEEFDPGWRAARITQLLQGQEKLSMADMQRIQTDVFSIPGKELAGYFAALPNPAPRLSEAIKRLQNWDGRLSADSVGGALYKATYQFTLENMHKAAMGKTFEDYADERFHILLMLKLVKDPTHPLWGEGGRDAALTKALGQAVDYLTTTQGSNVDNWQWGKLHTMDFSHNPLGQGVPGPLQFMVNLKVTNTGGDGTTVAAASYRYSKPFAQRSGGVYRGIYNLADWDNSFIIVTPGQSAQQFSPYFGSNLDKWVAGQYNQLPFSPEAVNREKGSVLTLNPK